MTAAAKPAGQGGARPPGLAANLTVAIVCLAGAAGYVALALALPAGHSQGDAGPAALPLQVGIFGLIVSGLYLVLTLRGRVPAAEAEPGDPVKLRERVGPLSCEWWIYAGSVAGALACGLAAGDAFVVLLPAATTWSSPVSRDAAAISSNVAAMPALAISASW